MMTTSQKCHCCGDACGSAAPRFDVVLGFLCGACADGSENGRGILRKFGVRGIYIGPCPDHRKGQP